MFLGITALGGAFFPGCPFRSAFSGVIRLIFDILQTLSKWIHFGCRLSKKLRRLWIGTLIVLWFASNVWVVYATFNSGYWFGLFFFPTSVPIVYSAQQEVVQKPQKYSLPLGIMGVYFRLAVNDPCDILRLFSNIFTPIWYWIIRHRLCLLDGQ